MRTFLLFAHYAYEWSVKRQLDLEGRLCAADAAPRRRFERLGANMAKLPDVLSKK